MYRHAITVLLAGALAAPALAASVPDLPVTWEAAKSWELIDTRTESGETKLLYVLHGLQIERRTEAVATVLLRLYRTTASEQAWNPDAILAERMSLAEQTSALHATLVVAARDDRHWSSYLYRAEAGGERTLMLYRIGMVAGVAAEVIVSFPSLAAGPREQLTRLTLAAATVTQGDPAGLELPVASAREFAGTFNRLCAGLAVSGARSCVARATLTDAPRAGAPSRP